MTKTLQNLSRVAIGIDVGTSAVKVIAVAEDGEVLERREVAVPALDAEARLVGAESRRLVGGDREGARRSHRRRRRHRPLGADARPRHARRQRPRRSGPAILWNDQRTGAECAEIEERVGFDRLVELTGNRALTGFTAPKLVWLRKHEPENYARIAHVMLPKDYVRLKLTGERAIDVADASGTLLLDVAQRRWSDEVLAALEIDAAWLPTVLESPEVSGRTAAGVAVAAGAGDQAAGGLGVGVDRPGPLSVAMGTSGVVFAALPEYRADPQARVHAFCHAVPGAWHQMGVMLSAAGSLRVAARARRRRVLRADRPRPSSGAGNGGADVPAVPDRRAHAARRPRRRGAFTGLEIRHDRGALMRAVLEGVACGLRDSFDLVGGASAAACPAAARAASCG